MRVKKKARGQALFELALVLGVVVLLAVGAIQSLYSLYLTRQVRAAAEELADLAAVYGGDGPALREQVPLVLSSHRLDENLASVQVDPAAVGYLDPFVLTLDYDVVIHFYGLFDLRLAPQQVRRLGEGG